ncbi:Na(+)/H(+) antiporter subunit F [Phycisphaera mikurensis NBRC 102666]|uniref:Na(+)/H(+) antiporter subunit F n=2 Tax=Phycisphaera TaxID=666508 RepID=I0IC41_PHYMF|nr:Na(+)/H(+) antiporter subunit F [Phycisphaera mikurensis NBRC 102666]
MLGLASICAGMVLCLYRLWRGPGLADRVLASDVFAFHVVALVILLSVYLRNLTFFDAALGVAIVGFASTVGFAQYIGARQRSAAADRPLQEEPHR